MVGRLYAFFSEQLVRMATTRNAVRNALAKLVQAHMNLENTNRAKNVLKNAINKHLRATINVNTAKNHLLKNQGYKYSNANRANILKRVIFTGPAAVPSFNNRYDINTVGKKITLRPGKRIVRAIERVF
jgi:hypothetical protein